MNKKTSKILAGILAASTVVSLTACGGDGGSDAPITETTTAKTEWTGDNI